MALFEADAHDVLSVPDPAKATLMTLPERLRQSRRVKPRPGKLGG